MCCGFDPGRFGAVGWQAILHRPAEQAAILPRHDEEAVFDKGEQDERKGQGIAGGKAATGIECGVAEPGGEGDDGGEAEDVEQARRADDF